MNTENLYVKVTVTKDEVHYLSKYVEDDESVFIIECGTNNWWRAEDFFFCKDIKAFVESDLLEEK